MRRRRALIIGTTKVYRPNEKHPRPHGHVEDVPSCCWGLYFVDSICWSQVRRCTVHDCLRAHYLIWRTAHVLYDAGCDQGDPYSWLRSSTAETRITRVYACIEMNLGLNAVEKVKSVSIDKILPMTRMCLQRTLICTRTAILPHRWR